MTDLRLIFADPKKFEGPVEVEGWIRNNRDSKQFGFIELNDGTYFKSVQIVYERDIVANYDEIAHLPLATALSVKGELVLHRRQSSHLKSRQRKSP